MPDVMPQVRCPVCTATPRLRLSAQAAALLAAGHEGPVVATYQCMGHLKRRGECNAVYTIEVAHLQQAKAA